MKTTSKRRARRNLLGYSCFVLLLGVVFLLFAFNWSRPQGSSIRLQIQKFKEQATTGGGGGGEGGQARKKELLGDWVANKIALLIPFTGPNAKLPHFAPLWSKTIAASSPFLQVYILHEHEGLQNGLGDAIPPNIHFINIGEDAITKRLARVWEKSFPDTRKDVEETIKEALQKNPRGLSSFRPLYCQAFHDYLASYSHWAWGDMDELFGDLTGLVNASDLEQFDILSFGPGYGWYYTQGQFTVLKNSEPVCSGWKKVSSAKDLISSTIPWAWEEKDFSSWALYSSSLSMKFFPLQYEGREGHRTGPKATTIWDNGRLLVHFDYDYATASTSPEPLPKIPFQKTLKYQSTWANPSQMSGPWCLEKRGSLDSCWWYGLTRQARGYTFTTEEWLFLHFNYVREEKRMDNLENRPPEDIKKLAHLDRLVWQHDPFDILDAPPCGHPGGGYCPIS